jgi:ABC-type branched-subunit amino acid transport system ATPase component
MTVMLTCKNVSKRFGGLLALNLDGMEAHSGEILGLVGPNGSGKTTLINVISGFYQPTSGQIAFNGTNITGSKPNQLAHIGIARTYQIPRPFQSMRVIDNVAMAWMFGREKLDRIDALEHSRETLAFVGLGKYADGPVSKLNLHQRKFLEMARALALEPKLLLLDEVLAGLNPAEVELGIALIQRIRDQDISLIFVEHNIRAVMRLSDRMVVLNYGQKIAEGQPDDVINQESVVTAYLGKDYVHS